jgi:hypothetical protein
MSWLKDLFGGRAKPAAKKAAPQKTYKAPTNRAALIAEALAVRDRARAQTQGMLEQTLKDLLKKPPRPSDVEGMTRLLTLRQAILTLKGHMAHDLKRYQVLAGVKTLLESDGKPQNPGSSAPGKPKAGAAKPPSQGLKR